jgi:hypothetical protein
VKQIIEKKRALSVGSGAWLGVFPNRMCSRDSSKPHNRNRMSACDTCLRKNRNSADGGNGLTSRNSEPTRLRSGTGNKCGSRTSRFCCRIGGSQDGNVANDSVVRAPSLARTAARATSEKRIGSFIFCLTLQMSHAHPERGRGFEREDGHRKRTSGDRWL